MTWELDPKHLSFDDNIPKKHKFEDKLFHPSIEDVRCNGLALSPFLNMVACWIGTRLWFCKTRPGVLENIEWANENNIVIDSCESLRCLDVRFSPCSKIAISMWGTSPQRDADMSHIHGKMLRIYHFSGSKVLSAGTLNIQCEPRMYCFHPFLKLVSITTTNGILLYDLAGPNTPQLINKLCEHCIRENMTISYNSDDKNNKPSPPSTAQTVEFIKGKG